MTTCAASPCRAWFAGIALWLLACAPVAVQAGTFERGLLWRIDRPGSEGTSAEDIAAEGIAAERRAPSHLFGTLHIDDPRATAFSPALRAALATSRTFMPELLPDPQSGQRFALATQLNGAQTLASVAGADVAARVTKLLVDRYRLPADEVAVLKPWAAYLYLSQPPANDATGRRGEIVDAALYREARARRLPIRPLESVTQQIAALEAVPLSSQVALLDALARHHDEAMAAVSRLTDRYLAEDLAGLRALEEAPAGRGPRLRAATADLMRNLLDRRNDQMLQALLPQLELGGAFAAMGALHLHGERGLLALLERAGWRVQRVE